MKKILSLMLAVLLCFGMLSTLFSCKNDDNKVDKNKTQLYVSNYNGGQGTDWLWQKNSIDTLVGRFEAAYANTSFEDGKTGVQVHVRPVLEKGTNVLTSAAASPEEIFFSEDIPYWSAASQGRFLDVSDVVADIINPAKNPGVSMDSTKLNNLSVDGKYYAIPHYEIYKGINYDKSLFASEGLYFAIGTDPDGTHKFVNSETEPRSAGPDGKMGTSDDGLPATVQEFYKLCDYMTTKNITPLVWSGEHPFCFNYIFESFYANDLTDDEWFANYSFDSNGKTTRVITGFNGTTPIIKDVVITKENGYLVRQQASKYYALEFMYKLYNTESWYYPDSVKSSVFSSKMAQDAFVRNRFAGGTTKPIAMLVDGNWWYNEARNTINEVIANNGAEAASREFGFMPIPTARTAAEGAVGKEMKLINSYNSYVFIKSNIDNSKVKAAKEFLRFCYTEQNLQQFSLDTGLAKAVNYNMTSAQLEQLPGFSSELLAHKMANGSYEARSDSPIFLKHFEAVNLSESNIPGIGGFDFATTGYKNSKVTPINYFMGMWISETDWNNNYNK